MRLNGNNMLQRTSAFIGKQRMQWRALRRCQAGISLTEFALALPMLMVLGTTGLAPGHYITTMRKVSHLPAMMSDNALRMDGTPNRGDRRIPETERKQRMS